MRGCRTREGIFRLRGVRRGLQGVSDQNIPAIAVAQQFGSNREFSGLVRDIVKSMRMTDPKRTPGGYSGLLAASLF